MTRLTWIRHATLVDGTGAPARPGDLVLAGERIVCAGDAAEAEQSVRAHTATGVDLEEIDARGLSATPGFIDVHTHDDAQVLLNPGMLAKLSQGVTTVITGNCGLSLVPLVTQAPVPPLDLLHTQRFRYPTLQAYAQAVAQAQPALNVASLVGHTALRAAVMERLDRPATVAECEAMGQLLDAAMAQGALGLSSGVFYLPAFAADLPELQSLARVVGRHGGVYATHIRTEMQGILDAMEEAADTAAAGPVPLILSHHKCAGPANWGRAIETLAWIDRRASGQDIAMDVYPYTAGSTLLREDLVDGVIEILVTRSDPHPDQAGRWLADIARDWGVDQQEACRRLSPGGACYFQMSEDDVRRVMAHPRSMIGSDGLPHDERPHPRLWGTFPRVLARYWREQGLLGLEQAVHKMTGLSAQRFGLRGRGVLAPGAVADVVLLDAQRVTDRASYEDPFRMSEGIERVYVNGRLAFAGGAATGERSGRFVTRTSE